MLTVPRSPLPPRLAVVFLLTVLGPGWGPGRGVAASLPELPLRLEMKGEAAWPNLLSADGKTLVGESNNDKERHVVVVWDASTGKWRGRWPITDHEAQCRALSPDGTILVSHGPGSELRLREVPTG